MDFKHLHYFITVVEEGTISAAARKLHISQPPLSIAMKQLENELETTLFHRGSRNIILTETGEMLYQKACTILELCIHTTEDIKDLSKGIYGTLKLGIASSVENMFLKEFLIEFHSLYPDIKFELNEANTYHLLEMLEANIIEAAVIRTPFPATNFEYINLCPEPMVAIGLSSFFEKCCSDKIQLSMLSKIPLIIYRRWHGLLEQEFKKSGISPQILCINDDARTTTEWALHGLGVGIIPKSAIPMTHCENIEIHQITCHELISNIVCIFAPQNHRSAAMKYFYDYMKQHIISD